MNSPYFEVNGLINVEFQIQHRLNRFNLFPKADHVEMSSRFITVQCLDLLHRLVWKFVALVWNHIKYSLFWISLYNEFNELLSTNYFHNWFRKRLLPFPSASNIWLLAQDKTQFIFSTRLWLESMDVEPFIIGMVLIDCHWTLTGHS